MCTLMGILLFTNADASISASSSLTQQSAKVDCTPYWYLAWVTDTNKLGSQISSVAVSKQNNIWALGPRFTMLTSHWDGTRWNNIYAPKASKGVNSLSAIAVAGPKDIWAVGWYFPVTQAQTSEGYSILSFPLIEHWDGTRWRIVSSPHPGAESALFSVSVVGPKDVWAVGSVRERSWDRPLILHLKGTTWKQVKVPSLTSPLSSGAHLTAIKAIKSNDVWAVGTQNIDADGFSGETLILHWDGKRWTEMPSLGQGRLLSIASASANDVWAVGFDSNIRRHEAFYYKTLIIHWDGKRWKRVPSPTPEDNSCQWCFVKSELFGIVLVSSKEIWAFGSQDTISKGTVPLLLKWNGAKWSIAVEPSTGYRYDKLNEITTSGEKDLNEVGWGWYHPVLAQNYIKKCKSTSAREMNSTP